MTRAELLDLLKKARKQLKKYHVPMDEQTVTLSIDTLENALSEQPQIVRCKDCNNRECDGRAGTIVCGITGFSHSRLWFCADGERRENE